LLGLRTCASGSPVACPQLSTEFRSAAMRNSFFKPGGLFTDFEEAMKRTECAECRSALCITHAVCRRISDQVVGAQYPSLLSSSARMHSKLTIASALAATALCVKQNSADARAAHALSDHVASMDRTCHSVGSPSVAVGTPVDTRTRARSQ